MMQSEIDFICRHGIFNDYKTRLQEYLQRDGDADIHYVLLGSTGPEHNKVFTSQVMLGNTVIGEAAVALKRFGAACCQAGAGTAACKESGITLQYWPTVEIP